MTTKEMGCRDVGAFKSDEKIYQALHANGKSSQVMLAALKKKDCFTVNQYEVDKKQFEIRDKYGLRMGKARACLKIAFCKIPSQFASDFMLDLGGVVGYIDEIQHIIRCKVGRKIVGMNFQTRSRQKGF